ncbi:hypothetical protein PG995_009926 [Apiospora arundinis]
MADPLSIAGLVTGLVSLGLQITGTVISYLDAIETREHELVLIRHQVEAVQGSLQLVDSLRSRVHGNLQASDNLTRNIRLCEAELSILACTLHDEATRTPITGQSLQQRWSRTKHKLTYPLREPAIHRLQSRVEKLNGLLQIALQAMEIELQLSTLDTASRAHADTISTTKEVSRLMNPIIEIHDAVSELRGAIVGIRPVVQGSCKQDFGRVEKVVREHQLLSPTTKSSRCDHKATCNELLARLIAKPDSLRELSNAVDYCGEQMLSIGNEVPATAILPGQPCSEGFKFCEQFCQRRSNRKYCHSDWGVVAISHEKQDVEMHAPKCPFAGTQPTGSIHTWGVALTGLQRLIGRSLTVSLSMTTGAGGYSIKHAIRYNATVDPKTAPAFRLIHLALDCVGPGQQWQKELSLAHQNHIVNLCVRTILEMFRRSRARPTDLLPAGDSLITCISSLILSSPGAVSPLLLSLLKAMVKCRVPVRIRVRPLHLPENPSLKLDVNIARGILGSLVSEDTIILPPEATERANPNSLLHTHSLLAVIKSPAFAEMLGYNPLCMAVLAGDDQKVAEILRLDPDCIEETTITGRSALDLAVREPACLRLLLQHVKPHMLPRRGRVRSPPLAALQLSSLQPCSVQRVNDPAGEADCHRPECVALDLFLEAGCEQRFDDLQSTPWHRAAPHAKMIYLRHMQKRRHVLKDLALQYLPVTLAASLGLSSMAIPDTNVVAIIENLQAIKVQIPPTIEGLHQEYTRTSPGGSIYHYIQNVEDAELVWNLGFCDVLALDMTGRPAISKTRDIPYIGWLYAHGVDMFLPWHRSSEQAVMGTTDAHYAASLILPEVLRQCHNDDAQSSIVQLAPILFADVYDCCECLCSQQGGCSPLLSGLKAACKESASLTEAYDSLSDSFADFMDLDVARAMTRLFTFETLSLPHTCCMFQGDNFTKEYTAAEITELNHVFSQDIDRFGECIDFLFHELETLHNYSHINGGSLKAFLETTWTVRMQKELTEKLKVEKEELSRNDTAEIGVVWHPSTSDERPDFNSLEFWVGEIDKISEGRPTTYQNYKTV